MPTPTVRLPPSTRQNRSRECRLLDTDPALAAEAATQHESAADGATAPGHELDDWLWRRWRSSTATNRPMLAPGLSWGDTHLRILLETDAGNRACFGSRPLPSGPPTAKQGASWATN